MEIQGTFWNNVEKIESTQLIATHSNKLYKGETNYIPGYRCYQGQMKIGDQYIIPKIIWVLGSVVSPITGEGILEIAVSSIVSTPRYPNKTNRASLPNLQSLR